MYLSGTDPRVNDPAIMAAQSAAFKKLHAAAASIADSKARYAKTGDERYLASIRAVLPLYRQALTEYGQAGAEQLKLSGMERFLLDTQRWVEGAARGAVKVVKGAVAVPLTILDEGSKRILILVALLGLTLYGVTKAGGRIRGVHL